MELSCHPLLAAQERWQHKPDSSQMKQKSGLQGHTCCASTNKGGHCLRPTRASPEKTLKKSIECGRESSAAFFPLYRPVSSETACFYRCSLWMPGAPEILQSIQVQTQVLIMSFWRLSEASAPYWRGKSSLYENWLRQIPRAEMQEKCLEELGPIQG